MIIKLATFATLKAAKEYISGWKQPYLNVALEKIADAQYDIELWPTHSKRILEELTSSIEALQADMNN